MLQCAWWTMKPLCQGKEDSHERPHTVCIKPLTWNVQNEQTHRDTNWVSNCRCCGKGEMLEWLLIGIVMKMFRLQRWLHHSVNIIKSPNCTFYTGEFYGIWMITQESCYFKNSVRQDDLHSFVEELPCADLGRQRRGERIESATLKICKRHLGNVSLVPWQENSMMEDVGGV